MKNPKAEKKFLGCLLAGNNEIKNYVNMISVDMFCDRRYGLVWSAMLSLHQKSNVIDIVSIQQELTDAGVIGDAGGEMVLVDIMESAISSTNAPYFAKIIKELYQRRSAVIQIMRAKKAIENGDSNMEKSLRGATSAIFSLIRNNYAIGNIDEIIEMAFSQIIPDLSWGIKTIDQTTLKLHRKEVHVIAGRPGSGKTTFIADLTKRMLNLGYKVLLVSLEMPAWRIMEKIIASTYRVNMKALDGKSKYCDDFKNKMTKDWNNRLRIIDQTTGVNNVFKIPHILSQDIPDVLIIDYVQFGLYGNSIRLDVARAMNMLKVLSVDNNIAVITAAQLNRESVKRDDIRPLVSDLKEAGAIEEFACNILLLHWPYNIRPLLFNYDDYEIIVGKARYGEVKVLKFRFEPQYSIFEEVRKNTNQLAIQTD